MIPLVQFWILTTSPFREGNKVHCHGLRLAWESGRIIAFGYRHSYWQVLADHVTCWAHSFAVAVCFRGVCSRYWAYGDQELADLVYDFRENNAPLDVIVFSYHPESARAELSQVHHPYPEAQISVQQVLGSIISLSKSDDKFAKQISRDRDEAPVPKRT